jgi:hypothetical protein
LTCIYSYPASKIMKLRKLSSRSQHLCGSSSSASPAGEIGRGSRVGKADLFAADFQLPASPNARMIRRAAAIFPWPGSGVPARHLHLATVGEQRKSKPRRHPEEPDIAPGMGCNNRGGATSVSPTKSLIGTAPGRWFGFPRLERWPRIRWVILPYFLRDAGSLGWHATAWFGQEADCLETMQIRPLK